jgi:hypothetical protein
MCMYDVYSNSRKRGRHEVESEFNVDAEGKLIINESEDEEEGKGGDKKSPNGGGTIDVEDEDEEKDIGTSYNKKKSNNNTKGDRHQNNGKDHANGVPSNKRQKLNGNNNFKKAGGDVSNGKVQPYAFVPLDHRFLNRKKKGEAPRQYVNIVQAAKKHRKEEKKNNRNTSKY